MDSLNGFARGQSAFSERHVVALCIRTHFGIPGPLCWNPVWGGGAASGSGGPDAKCVGEGVQGPSEGARLTEFFVQARSQEPLKSEVDHLAEAVYNHFVNAGGPGNSEANFPGAGNWSRGPCAAPLSLKALWQHSVNAEFSLRPSPERMSGRIALPFVCKIQIGVCCQNHIRHL